FGGQSKGPDNPTQAARTCAAADRTGHALLHTLYQANLKAGTSFLNEWYAVDLVKNQDGAIVGSVQLVRPPRNNEAQAFAARLEHSYIAPYARGHG
ncbi:FAD-binding protein, partial [Klebsiella pneumoniae]